MHPTIRASLLLAAALFIREGAATGCAADNCYRALFPCPSPSAVSVAAAFCATITADGTTATNYPTRATNACGPTPYRYISACQCGPTCSTSIATSTSTSTSTTSTTTVSTCSPTPTNGGLVYGDFECTPNYLAPWAVSVLDTGVSTILATPGFTKPQAYKHYLAGSRSCSLSDSNCINVRLSYPSAVPVTPGGKYKLTYAVRFDGSDTSARIRPLISGNVLPETSASSTSAGLATWKFVDVPYEAGPSQTTALVEFESIVGYLSLDTVTFAPVDAYIGSVVPLGVVPDGEFETGTLGSWTQTIIDPDVFAGVVSLSSYPSSSPNGNWAWQVGIAVPPVPGREEPWTIARARIRSASFPVTPGQKYALSFKLWSSVKSGWGWMAVWINDNPVWRRYPNEVPHAGGVFGQIVLYWTAPVDLTNTTIRFECSFNSPGTFMVDSVILVAVN
ncbi:hypothetical protein QBC38DRAFT_487640 [Podospora fimiseda]|uniref:CBM-cenC domain-containing protein n=1 Tax=Podospora fimiseda TaxID=252190 RepID=A0AAN7BHD1_9PEZI|nr:hypothetical protein QBC38DRAFT_487640 [Podospora fimiseda]